MTREEYNKAIHLWYVAARNGGTGAHIDSCIRAARALEIERDTGKVVCSCHLLSFDDCRKLKKK